MSLLSIRDETIYGQVLHEQCLVIEEEYPTIHTLIVHRVATEVERFNRRKDAYFRGLVQPQGSLPLPPGFRLPRFRPLEVADQIKAALQAFRKGRFYVLIDGSTAIRLDQRFEASPSTEISFLLMSPVMELEESL